MASIITAAARALASGDALGALTWIALRDDAPALALRGIAMAPSQARARALRDRRAEIALVSRELDWCFNGMVTAPTPRMRVSSRCAYSC
jgi:hypothetical protein